MNPRVAAVLKEFSLREATERKAFKSFDNETYLRQRDSLLLGIGPDAGRFLNLLIKAKRPRHILELGTAFGYSTLWLAEAAATVGATITSLEIMPEKLDYAAEMLDRAGLQDYVTFVQGDAVQLIASLDRPVDFALIDLWKELYIPTFSLLYPQLSRGAVVCADNMLFPEYQRESAAAYIAHVRSVEGAESITVPVGSGIEFSMFRDVSV